MSTPVDVGLLIASGIAGGLLGIRLRLPIGGLVGAIAGAGGYHLVTGATFEFGPGLRLVAQGLVGMIVGASVSLHLFRTLRQVLLRALAFSAMMVVAGVVLGWLVMSQLGHVDLLTAFLSAAPAGAMEMGAAALATYADAEVVMATHILRIVSIGFLGGTMLPLLARRRAREVSRAPHELAATGGDGMCTRARSDRDDPQDLDR